VRKSQKQENNVSAKTRVTTLVIIGSFLLLAAVACGGEATPTAEPTERPLMSFDFEDVCRRGTVEKAPAYEPQAGSGKIHPLIAFRRDPGNDSFYHMSPASLKLPIPWMVDIGEDHGTVELVVCMDGIDSSLADVCTYDDDESDDEFVLRTYNTTYQVTVYRAKTGEEVASTTVEAAFDDCPMFHMFSDQEEDTYAYPPAGPLEEFLQQYVEP
jgi:hypothetical protein